LAYVKESFERTANS